MLLSSRSSPDYFDYWVRYGGDSTLKSYGLPIEEGSLLKIPESHWNFFESCQDYYESENFIFSHSPINPDKHLKNENPHELRWNHKAEEKKHTSGKVNIHGHTSQKSGKPLIKNNGICIDTYSYGGGFLTCLDTTNFELTQSNEHGELRTQKIKAN